jgi:hypothetical protein
VFTPGDLIAAFVVTPAPLRETLFVGMYRVTSLGVVPQGIRDPIAGRDVSGLHLYEIQRATPLAEYAGHLTITWGKGFRTWVQRASSHEHDKVVRSIRDQIEPPFPGFTEFRCAASEVPNLYPSWQEVLRNVKGVYVLVCQATGKQYIGSAKGEESLLGRFFDYARDGHGGDVGLREQTRDHSCRYQVSVLAVLNADYEILAVENAWKEKLMTRQFGLNRN